MLESWCSERQGVVQTEKKVSHEETIGGIHHSCSIVLATERMYPLGSQAVGHLHVSGIVKPLPSTLSIRSSHDDVGEMLFAKRAQQYKTNRECCRECTVFGVPEHCLLWQCQFDATALWTTKLIGWVWEGMRVKSSDCMAGVVGGGLVRAWYLTTHWMTADWKVVSWYLGTVSFPEHHTAQNFAHKFEKLMQSFNVSPSAQGTLVHNLEANMDLAGTILETDLPDFCKSHVCCTSPAEHNHARFPTTSSLITYYSAKCKEYSEYSSLLKRSFRIFALRRLVFVSAQDKRYFIAEVLCIWGPNVCVQLRRCLAECML